MKFETHSEAETIAAGRTIAKHLVAPKLVLLRGDLGAGKTTLVKGIADALEAAAPDEVTSPTFTLVHEYRGPHTTVYHLDLYRIESESELATIGLDDLRDGSLVLVEWGEKFPSLVRDADAEVVITTLEQSDSRTIVFTPKSFSL